VFLVCREQEVRDRIVEEMTLEYAGDQALILGGSCELALYLARAMIQRSLRPVLTYRNEGGLERIARDLEDLPNRYESRRLDLGNQSHPGYFPGRMGRGSAGFSGGLCAQRLRRTCGCGG